MASADCNLLGFGSTGRVDKLDVNGSIVARKSFNDQQCYTHESKILKELQRFPHKNIVQLLGFGTNYVDLELVSGGTLGDTMRIQHRYSTFTSDDVKTILIGCLEALTHLHRALGRAHFDVKPENILLTETKQPKLCDFSHSRNPASVRIAQGTFEYMPAELFRGEASNFSIDVYSLGITLIQFICHRHPYMSSQEMHESEDRRQALLKIRTQQEVPITGVQFTVAPHLIQTLHAMSETNIKLRPLPERVLELLRVEQLEQQVAAYKERVRHLEQEKQALVGDKQALLLDKQALTSENQRLQETVKRKREEYTTHTAASLPRDLPPWMKIEWTISSQETTLAHAMAGRLDLADKCACFMEFALYLRQLYLQKLGIQIQPKVPPHLNAAIAELDQHHGLNRNGKPVELLLICCLAITHARKGAINLIEEFQVDNMPLRNEDTLRKHYDLLLENHMVPVLFQTLDPHNDKPAPTKKVKADPSKGWTSSNWVLPAADEAEVLKVASNLKLSEQADDYLQLAKYLRNQYLNLDCERPAGMASLLAKMEKQCGAAIEINRVQLLLISVLAITHSLKSAVSIITEFKEQGQSLRGQRSLEYHYAELKAKGPLPMRFRQCNEQAPAEPEDGELPASTSSTLHAAANEPARTSQPAAQREVDEVIRVFGESQGLGEFAAASLECAHHIHLSNTASAPTLSGPALDYLTHMVDSEGRTTLGPYTKLLLMSCLSILHLPTATSKLISEFQFQGAPLRNFEGVKKCLFRMKNNNEIPIELL